MENKEDGTEFQCQYHFRVGEGRIFLEGVEVLRVTLNPDNLATGLYERISKSERFIAFTEEVTQQFRDYARKRIAETNLDFNEEQINQLMESAVRGMELDYVKKSIEIAKKDVSEKFEGIVLAFWEKFLNIASFAGANALRDMLNVPELKYDSKTMEAALSRLERSKLRALIGEPATRGGARNVKHVWTDEERAQLAAKYEELQPVWIEAKRIAKNAQKSRERTRKKEWRAEVLRAYADLPSDLLERYANPKGDDAKPSDIAAIHAKRECGITEEYTPSHLRGLIRAWRFKAPS